MCINYEMRFDTNLLSNFFNGHTIELKFLYSYLMRTAQRLLLVQTLFRLTELVKVTYSNVNKTCYFLSKIFIFNEIILFEI